MSVFDFKRDLHRLTLAARGQGRLGDPDPRYVERELLAAYRAKCEALEAACRAWAYEDNCTLPSAALDTDSGWKVDRPAEEFRRFFESGGWAKAGADSRLAEQFEETTHKQARLEAAEKVCGAALARMEVWTRDTYIALDDALAAWEAVKPEEER